MPTWLKGLAALFCAVGAASAQPLPSVREAAQALIEATPAVDRPRLVFPFDESLRADWHYTPRRRDGIALKAMSPRQREASTALMRSVLADRGLAKVRELMALEAVLREIEGGNPTRDPDNYAIAIYGQPGGPKAAKGWGWRIEGHHLSLHFSLSGGPDDRVVATLPQFFGANPARVPHDTPGASNTSGPSRKGFRLLGTEEDLSRQWLASLDAAQRKSLLVDPRPYGDIVSRNAVRATPLEGGGLAFDAMSAAQQAQLVQLISSFAEHLRPDLAQARLARVRAAPTASLRVAWAGSFATGEPHYFRIQGATFLIEYDNSGGNHVHSVWRDFEGDFGRDVLREHYERAKLPSGRVR